MTKPYYAADGVTLYLGDSRDVLPTLAGASVDAIVTDPPYELGFMGKSWDASGIAYSVPLWRECLRVLKPGGHLVAFGGTRTYHRLAAAIEDAGFEVRDSLHWIYGSGFPKSLDVAKAIDKRREDRADLLKVAAFLAAARDCAGFTNRDIDEAFGLHGMAGHWTAGAHRKVVMVPQWEQWQRLQELLGFGPEMDAEVWRLNGRKGTPGEAWAQREVIGQRTTGIGTGRGAVPYIGDSENRDVTAPATEDAARWQGWGTALKPAHEPIVLARKPLAGTVAGNVLAHGTGALNIDSCRVPGGERPLVLSNRRSGNEVYGDGLQGSLAAGTTDTGRWPSNVILTHPPLVDEHGQPVGDACADGCVDACPVAETDRQSDGASRLFHVFRYEPKAPTTERPRLPDGTTHPTVKPLALMQWLVRLITPPGGTVLEPFAGSGTTLEAALAEGIASVGIERDEPHAELCRIRLSKPITTSLFPL
ncbi:DNA-methyltransferase [Streptomyces spiralis]